jgi:uncharacterized protein YcbK (DUF882 family)
MSSLLLPSRRTVILGAGACLMTQQAAAGVRIIALPSDFSGDPGKPVKRQNVQPKSQAATQKPIREQKAPAVSDSKRGSRRGDRFIFVRNTYDQRVHRAIFFSGGRYIDDETPAVNIALRDHYSGAIADMRRRLLDFMFLTYEKLNLDEPFFLVSGYRSPATNQMLRQRSLKRNGGKTGVAKHSPHMDAIASDVRARGRSTMQIYRAARRVSAQLGYGGVGLYTSDGFIHLDGNSLRTWGS